MIIERVDSDRAFPTFVINHKYAVWHVEAVKSVRPTAIYGVYNLRKPKEPQLAMGSRAWDLEDTNEAPE